MWLNYIHVCLVLTIFCLTLCSSNPVRHKRTAYLNIGEHHGAAFDDKDPKFISRMGSMLPFFGKSFYRKRSLRHSIRPKRTPDDYEGGEIYNDDNYFPPGFYPYKNVGSLYIAGPNTLIKQPLYNYGVDSYGYPPYGYPIPEPYYDSYESPTTTTQTYIK